MKCAESRPFRRRVQGVLCVDDLVLVDGKTLVENLVLCRPINEDLVVLRFLNGLPLFRVVPSFLPQDIVLPVL